MLMEEILQRTQQIQGEVRRHRLVVLNRMYGVSFESVLKNMILSMVQEEYFDNEELYVSTITVELDDIRAWAADGHNAEQDVEELTEREVVLLLDACGIMYEFIDKETVKEFKIYVAPVLG